MAAPKGAKQITLWVEPEEREALQALCKTMGTSVSGVLRKWILTAIQEQTTDFVGAKKDSWDSSIDAVKATVEPETLKALMKRMEKLERTMPKFDMEDLMRIRSEVLEGEFGSMRYRMGVMESQLQSLGGTIAWETNKDLAN